MSESRTPEQVFNERLDLMVKMLGVQKLLEQERRRRTRISLGDRAHGLWRSIVTGGWE